MSKAPKQINPKQGVKEIQASAAKERTVYTEHPEVFDLRLQKEQIHRRAALAEHIFFALLQSPRVEYHCQGDPLRGGRCVDSENVGQHLAKECLRLATDFQKGLRTLAHAQLDAIDKQIEQFLAEKDEKEKEGFPQAPAPAQLVNQAQGAQAGDTGAETTGTANAGSPAGEQAPPPSTGVSGEAAGGQPSPDTLPPTA